MNTTITPSATDHAAYVYDIFKTRFLTFLTATVGGVEEPDADATIEDTLHRRLKDHFTHLITVQTLRGMDHGREDTYDVLVAQAHVKIWRGIARLAFTDRTGLWDPKALADKLARKRVDYGWKNIVDFGEVGIIIRTVDKVYRIGNLRGRAALLAARSAQVVGTADCDTLREGVSLVGESISDAHDDILGYAAVAVLFLSRQWDDASLEGE